MLLKPTAAIEHGGGVRFAPDSLEYRVLAEWIAAGTPRPSADGREDPIAERLPRLGAAPAGRSSGHPRPRRLFRRPHRRRDPLGQVREHRRDRRQGGRRGPRRRSRGTARPSVDDLVRQPRRPDDDHRRPTRSPIDPKVFADAPRRNPIDEKNLAKLRALGIPPSPDAGDAAFLRRAYLDATGTLPPAEAGRRLPGRPRPREAGEAGRSPAGQSPNTSTTGRTSGRDLFLVSLEEAARARRCGRSTGSIREVRRRERPVGQVRPRDRHREGRHAQVDGAGELLRPPPRPDRPDREREHGLPRPLADLRPLPQPPDGEVDPGPVLRHGEPLRPRQPQGRRRDGRRGRDAVGRAATSATRGPGAIMPPQPLDAKALPCPTPRRPPRGVRRLARRDRTTRTSPARSSTASGGTSSAAA